MAEPLEIAAGTTWSWRRDDIGNYPASLGWSLNYYLRSASARIDIEAAGDGMGYLVNLAAATTAGFQAGRYAWSAIVSKAGEKYEVGRGTIVVLPNLAAATNVDGRSHARKVLDAIEAVIEGRASIDQQRFVVEGMELSRTPLEDLTKFRIFYTSEVAREEAIAKAANGQGSARRILTRFS